VPGRVGFRESFRFPLGGPDARRDLLTGALLLLIPVVGWVANLGHRLDVVQRLLAGRPPYFRGFRPLSRTLRRGAPAAFAIAGYLLPGALLAALAATRWPVLGALAVPALLLAVYALPGGMTWYAATGDPAILYRPDRALRRARQGGAGYLRAWAVGLSAIALSPLGLLAFGAGFLLTSVWAWSVVGYAFSRALPPTDRRYACARRLGR
jgi:hypothetical protein